MSRDPELSVIVVAPAGYAGIRRVVEHLAEQTAADRIELVIVAPSAESLGVVPLDGTAPLLAVRRVDVGPIVDVEAALVPGVSAASAPVVALLEDHAYPDREWARRTLDAHRGPWAAVGPSMLNANPISDLSWTNMLLAYGRWPETGSPGEVGDIARHNSAFKRDVLLSYGDRLESLIARAGGLLPAMRADGHRFYFEPRARVRHVNPSTLTATAQLRFQAGRLYAGARAAAGRWSAARRLVYIAGAPLIPPARLFRQHRQLLAGRRGWEAARILPAVVFGLALDAAGQAMGYAMGAGAARERLATFEMDRARHITRRDRASLGAK